MLHRCVRLKGNAMTTVHRRAIPDNTTAALSIVVPIYNESVTLEELYNRLAKQLRQLTSDYEIIFVDDGSTDGSLPMLLRLHQQNCRVKVLSLSRNFGHQT